MLVFPNWRHLFLLGFYIEKYIGFILKSRFRQLYNIKVSAKPLNKGLTLIFTIYKLLYGTIISQIFFNLFNVFGR